MPILLSASCLLKHVTLSIVEIHSSHFIQESP